MFELWIPITVAAAFLQNLRMALQKRAAAGRFSVLGATTARYLFAFPLALAYVGILTVVLRQPMPTPNGAFSGFVAFGAVTQILATICLLEAFARRGFAVGTAFSKTETLQTALFSIVILGEGLTWGAAGAILVSLIGVFLLTLAPGQLRGLPGVREMAVPAAIGIASGGLFGLSAVSFRGAALALEAEGFLLPAATTLAAAIGLQTLLLSAYLPWREPGQLRQLLRHWPHTLAISTASFWGSVCWFSAMTLMNAAYVRALGQVELIFTYWTSRRIFRETLRGRELLGLILVAGGVIWLVLH